MIDRACEGKKAYTSWRQATFDARYLARKEHFPFSVYRCRKCGGGVYHIGHTPARFRKGRRR